MKFKKLMCVKLGFLCHWITSFHDFGLNLEGVLYHICWWLWKRDNTFLVKRECWCICNFERYFDVYYHCILFHPCWRCFRSVQDVIIVYGHWCKTFVVSWGNIPQDEYNKMYFWASIGVVGPTRLRGRSSHFLGQSLNVYK